MPAQTEPALNGKKVLIIEDELLLADTLASCLCNAGATVLGPIGRLRPAMDFLEEAEPDAVALNLDLHGKSTLPLADLLQARDIPFVFVSGFDPSEVPVRLAKAPYLMKPCAGGDVVQALQKLLDTFAPR
jgi:two-component SAPR family response regulator